MRRSLTARSVPPKRVGGCGPDQEWRRNQDHNDGQCEWQVNHGGNRECLLCISQTSTGHARRFLWFRFLRAAGRKQKLRQRRPQCRSPRDRH